MVARQWAAQCPSSSVQARPRARTGQLPAPAGAGFASSQVLVSGGSRSAGSRAAMATMGASV